MTRPTTDDPYYDEAMNALHEATNESFAWDTAWLPKELQSRHHECMRILGLRIHDLRKIVRGLEAALNVEQGASVALAAWQDAFGTTQLTHALARLEAAENSAKVEQEARQRAYDDGIERAAQYCDGQCGYREMVGLWLGDNLRRLKASGAPSNSASPTQEAQRTSEPPPRSATWPYVLAFAEEMERKLAANRHKGDREGWLEDTAESLYDRLAGEANELREALDAPGAYDVRRITAEAADVANFAMMIADVAGGLAGSGPQGAETSKET